MPRRLRLPIQISCSLPGGEQTWSRSRRGLIGFCDPRRCFGHTTCVLLRDCYVIRRRKVQRESLRAWIAAAIVRVQ
jgi:hypothetical protein